MIRLRETSTLAAVLRRAYEEYGVPVAYDLRRGQYMALDKLDGPHWANTKIEAVYAAKQANRSVHPSR